MAIEGLRVDKIYDYANDVSFFYWLLRGIIEQGAVGRDVYNWFMNNLKNFRSLIMEMREVFEEPIKDAEEIERLFEEVERDIREQKWEEAVKALENIYDFPQFYWHDDLAKYYCRKSYF